MFDFEYVIVTYTSSGDSLDQLRDEVNSVLKHAQRVLVNWDMLRYHGSIPHDYYGLFVVLEDAEYYPRYGLCSNLGNSLFEPIMTEVYKNYPSWTGSHTYPVRELGGAHYSNVANTFANPARKELLQVTIVGLRQLLVDLDAKIVAHQQMLGD